MLQQLEHGSPRFNPSAGSLGIKTNVPVNGSGWSASLADTIRKPNVGDTERLTSLAAGSILAVLGLSRRSIPGLVVAATGTALAFRGATGHCGVYESLGVDTTQAAPRHQGQKSLRDQMIEVTQSVTINATPEQLYSFWRKLSQLPLVLTHIESIEELDSKRSHWVAKPAQSMDAKVEWDAEITRDEPNRLIEWRSLPSSMIETRGSIQFAKALGDRGTAVRVFIEYSPPGDRATHLFAKMLGKSPQTLIRDDLRNFRRFMEIGEIPTVSGQPRGTCAAKSTQQFKV